MRWHQILDQMIVFEISSTDYGADYLPIVQGMVLWGDDPYTIKAW